MIYHKCGCPQMADFARMRRSTSFSLSGMDKVCAKDVDNTFIHAACRRAQ
jgi:hypothetical protein